MPHSFWRHAMKAIPAVRRVPIPPRPPVPRAVRGVPFRQMTQVPIVPAVFKAPIAALPVVQPSPIIRALPMTPALQAALRRPTAAVPLTSAIKALSPTMVPVPRVFLPPERRVGSASSEMAGKSAIDAAQAAGDVLAQIQQALAEALLEARRSEAHDARRSATEGKRAKGRAFSQLDRARLLAQAYLRARALSRREEKAAVELRKAALLEQAGRFASSRSIRANVARLRAQVIRLSIPEALASRRVLERAEARLRVSPQNQAAIFGWHAHGLSGLGLLGLNGALVTEVRTAIAEIEASLKTATGTVLTRVDTQAEVIKRAAIEGPSAAPTLTVTADTITTDSAGKALVVAGRRPGVGPLTRALAVPEARPAVTPPPATSSPVQPQATTFQKVSLGVTAAYLLAKVLRIA